MNLLGNELGDGPIQVAIDPVLIIEVRIDEIIREARYCRNSQPVFGSK
jgi:hypothetical protein